MVEYTIKKQEGTFYVDYQIQDGKCYIIEEYGNMAKSTLVCHTTKQRCDNLTETDTHITITI